MRVQSCMRYLHRCSSQSAIHAKATLKRIRQTHASSIFMVNGFVSINESNGGGLPGPPSVERSTLLMALLLLSAGLMFSCRAGLRAAPAMRSGIVTVCTGVMPPNGVLLPPQNAFAARRGGVVAGRSLCVFGVSSGDVDVELRDTKAGGVIGSGLGGGRTGESARPAGERRAFLSVLISCCKAAFSDLVEPSSVRIASMSRSRSATSPSRVVMYSDCEQNSKLLETVKKTLLTFATVAEIARAYFVTQLAFLSARHFLILIGCGAPVVQSVVVRVCLHDGADVDFFLDSTRMNHGLAVLAFVGKFDGWGSNWLLVVLLIVLLTGKFVLCGIVISKVTGRLGCTRGGH